MKTSKVAITLNARTLNKLDRLVKRRVFPTRSKAIEQVLEEKFYCLDKSALERACEKLDPVEEVAMAEEGMAEDFKLWPEY